MKIKHLLILLNALCLVLVTSGCVSGKEETIDSSSFILGPADTEESFRKPETKSLDPVESLSRRGQDWLEDIEFLRDACKKEHIDPFYFCPEEEFDFKLDTLAAKVGELSDNDIVFEITSIVAGLGDTHSIVTLPQSAYGRRFPVGVRYFGDRLYLTAYQEGYEQFAPYLLHEIVAVNGVDAAYLTEKVNRLGNPFNTWFSRETFWRNYFLPAFFDWAGCDYKEGYTLQILNDNRNVESVELPAIPEEEYAQGEIVFAEHYYNLERHWRVTTFNSISTMSSQLPCFGV